MDDIFVGSLMTSPVTTVPADTPAKDAAALMLEQGISSAVVVDEDDKLVGILTSTDFVAIAAADESAGAFSVADHMTTEVVTTTAGASIQAVADLLIEHGIHHVPVVDETAGVVGMVTTTDLTAYLAGAVDSESPRAWT
ncbi:CBS domain-containing protein [Haloarcula salinisoli]|uniref:CBS domain-containing protein n=1 Tax=Haloarcula salinisoli TaxID=2487746 RepID=A0A8J8C7U3_9EURY|nr:CBS domain-containing protein [Halomicroarcula salinisoli]MBX0286053.1 CBS domain-containing protein [Halomicroarcula salinisoli]MBX0302459.1 CBS domain-containing protein [Halomicroarcula salinisoli]